MQDTSYLRLRRIVIKNISFPPLFVLTYYTQKLLNVNRALEARTITLTVPKFHNCLENVTPRSETLSRYFAWSAHIALCFFLFSAHFFRHRRREPAKQLKCNQYLRTVFISSEQLNELLQIVGQKHSRLTRLECFVILLFFLFVAPLF